MTSNPDTFSPVSPLGAHLCGEAVASILAMTRDMELFKNPRVQSEHA